MATPTFGSGHTVRTRIPRAHRRACCLLTAACLIVWSSVASAQDVPQDKGSAVKDVAKQVLLDPTTYVPAAVVYASMQLDWNTSQPLFQAGFVERNARYTQSGLSGDTPLGYGAGNRKLVMDSLVMIPSSMANNAVNRVLERKLIERFPNKRMLWKTIGFVERAAFASYASYVVSQPHFQQWRTNVGMMQGVAR